MILFPKTYILGSLNQSFVTFQNYVDILRSKLVESQCLALLTLQRGKLSLLHHIVQNHASRNCPHMLSKPLAILFNLKAKERLPVRIEVTQETAKIKIIFTFSKISGGKFIIFPFD